MKYFSEGEKERYPGGVSFVLRIEYFPAPDFHGFVSTF
jgi:hypothetical protein